MLPELGIYQTGGVIITYPIKIEKDIHNGDVAIIDLMKPICQFDPIVNPQLLYRLSYRATGDIIVYNKKNYNYEPEIKKTIKKRLRLKEIIYETGLSNTTVKKYLRVNNIKLSDLKDYTFGQIPYGYDYKNGTLVQNKQEQKIINYISDLKNEGMPLRFISRTLNEKNIKTKNNKNWHPNTVKKILTRNTGF